MIVSAGITRVALDSNESLHAGLSNTKYLTCLSNPEEPLPQVVYLAH